MRRIFALAALVAMTLSLLAPSLTSAQTGTPAAESTGSFGVPVGTAVPYIGSDGAEVGTITVNSVTDQFTGFDQSSAPQRGYHYAIAEVTISNTSNRPFEVNPGSFMGVDSDGFVAQQPYVTFTDASLTALEYADALVSDASVKVSFRSPCSVIPPSRGFSTARRMTGSSPCSICGPRRSPPARR